MIALTAPEQSGYKNHFTFGEGQKNYNFSLLNDALEARLGKKYQRFELRNGDCFPMDGWNDCERDLNFQVGPDKSRRVNNAISIV